MTVSVCLPHPADSSLRPVGGTCNCFRMVRRHCKTCGQSHEKPTGKGCQRGQRTDSAKTAKNPPDTANSGEILNILQDIQRQMASFEGRLESLEEPTETSDEGEEEETQTGDNEGQQVAQAAQMPKATPDTVRQDHEVMAEAMARMAEWGLDEDGMIDKTDVPRKWRNRQRKSGAVSTGMDSIKVFVDWPHFHIQKGPKQIAPELSDITAEEFVLGYLRMLDDPDSQFDRERMLSILKDILEDSVDFGWERAKAFYTMLGRQVEQRRLLWSDTEQILKLRLTHSRVSIPDTSTKPKRQTMLAKIKTCAAFQKGSCDQPADHGQFRHVCDYCLRVRSAVFPHSELKCKSKEGSNPKNA